MPVLAAVLAVLVATCPCALSLATPVAIAAATSRLARLGVLVTRSDAVEGLAQVDTVILDKTGTLTTGNPRVLETQTSPDGDFTLLLDPGDHELRVSPPVGSGAPEVIVLVPVPALDDVAIHMGTVTLPPAALILFELRDAAGLPVVGARVSAYFGATDEVPNPPVIAENLSDTSGRVRVRIPVASLVD